MTIPKLYEWHGQSMSLKEWSQVTGISYRTLYSRIVLRGLSFDEAIKGWHSRKRRFIYRGREYGVDELCKLFGMSKSTFNRKLEIGMTVKEIAGWAKETAELRQKMRKKKSQRPHPAECICWRCENNVCGCSWARKLVPVEGSCFKEHKTRYATLQVVVSCPKYIERERTDDYLAGLPIDLGENEPEELLAAMG